MRTTFSMIPGSWQEPIRVAGAIQRFQRVRVADVDEFKVHWRCRWCYRPTWPVVLDTGAFYDCVVDEYLEGTFADATRPHDCRDGARQ